MQKGNTPFAPFSRSRPIGAQFAPDHFRDLYFKSIAAHGGLTNTAIKRHRDREIWISWIAVLRRLLALFERVLDNPRLCTARDNSYSYCSCGDARERPPMTLFDIT